MFSITRNFIVIVYYGVSIPISYNLLLNLVAPAHMYVCFTHSVFAQKLGDWLDARDSDGTWCVAQVVRIETEFLRVNFQGYSSKFDEDIRLESSKV